MVGGGYGTISLTDGLRPTISQNSSTEGLQLPNDRQVTWNATAISKWCGCAKGAAEGGAGNHLSLAAGAVDVLDDVSVRRD